MRFRPASIKTHGIKRLIFLEVTRHAIIGVLIDCKPYAHPNKVRAGAEGRNFSPKIMDIISSGNRVVARIRGMATNINSSFVDFFIVVLMRSTLSKFVAIVGTIANLRLWEIIKVALVIEDEEW